MHCCRALTLALAKLSCYFFARHCFVVLAVISYLGHVKPSHDDDDDDDGETRPKGGVGKRRSVEHKRQCL